MASDITGTQFPHSGRKFIEEIGLKAHLLRWFRPISNRYNLKENIDYIYKYENSLMSRMGQPKKEVYFSDSVLRNFQSHYKPVEIGGQFCHDGRELWASYGAKGTFHSWFNGISKRFKLQENTDYVYIRKSPNPIVGGKPSIEVKICKKSLETIQTFHRPVFDSIGFPHNARDLWSSYGSNGKFHSWFNRLAQHHNFKEGTDYIQKGLDEFVYTGIQTDLTPNEGGRPNQEIYITLESLGRIQLFHTKLAEEIQKKVVKDKITEASTRTEGENILDMLRKPSTMVLLVGEYHKSLEEIVVLKEDKKVLTGKVEIYEKSPTTVTTSQIAKDCWFGSANAMNPALRDKGVIYRDQTGVWLPCSHISKTYYQIKALVIMGKTGKTKPGKMHLYWTLAGVAFIHETLKKEIAERRRIEIDKQSKI